MSWDRLRKVAETPLCPSMTQDGMRHIARNVDFIECSCEPECPDEAWWDRYRTAGDVLAMHRALPALLDVASWAGWYAVLPCDYVDDGTCLEVEVYPDERCGPCGARSALDRLREVAR